MQDGAPGHSARDTLEELAVRDILCLRWPAYSSDLNPIEAVWNWMKDWIQDHYEELNSYDAIRQAVQEAWEAVPQAYLEELIISMPARCQAVVDVNGMHTRY